MDEKLIQKYHNLFLANKPTYIKMNDYYKGITDAITTYKMVTERSNLKVNCNFLKKFIKEEVSYSVGNDITYISKSSNDDIVNTIDINFQSLSTQHDIELMKTMLKFNIAYELYYIENGEFKAKVISPLEGFLIKENNVVTGFGREYTIEGLTDEIYLDIYTSDSIYHYKVNKEEYSVANATTPNVFGFVPIGVARLGEDGVYETLYADIKGLQDAYETNLSDLTNEISDFRNAYLVLTGAQLDDGQASTMKQMGILQSSDPNTKFQWLVKNLNDAFIQNTLSTLEDKMYQLSQHINHNEQMQSNLSGLALRSRLISLEEKCKLNQRALTDCIKTRLKALFIWLSKLQGSNYDWRDIRIKFTPNIPQDDVTTADLISKLGDKLSVETALAQLSFIENPVNEVSKIKKEQEEKLPGIDLNNVGDGNGSV